MAAAEQKWQLCLQTLKTATSFRSMPIRRTNCSSPRKGNYVKHQRLGSAADARRVDSRRNISLRGNVRSRVHEKLYCSQIWAVRCRKSAL